jgi:isoquinoline 1-oxidoreductase subunit beta
MVTRRFFLKSSAAAGTSLILAFRLRSRAEAASNSFAPNAFLEIAADGKITIWCAKSEVGQGVSTSLPMIVAEELGCDWQRITIAQADLDPKYGDQLTGGSLSVRTSYASLRKAGAAARELLLSAAAAVWKVPSLECHAENSLVMHRPTGRKLGFESLLSAASLLPPPADPPLKKSSEFSLVGKPTHRTDSKAKVTGAAQFGIDTRVPGMLVASVERCPVYGGTPRRFNADKVRGMAGVRHVIEIKSAHLTHQFGDESGPGSRNYSCSGVAVVADSTWAAMQARKELQVEWNEGEYAQETTAALKEKFAQLLSSEATVIRNDGDFEEAHSGAAKKLEAIYEVPFLAHATMEPMNCTADVTDAACELWAPTQIPGAAAESVALALGIPKERVKVHVTFIGGGFGRRLIQDYAVEAALISREVRAPVKVVWSREDDVRHDFYRPAACHLLNAGLDAQGNLIAWRHRATSPSIDIFYNGTGISARAAAQLDSSTFPAYGVPHLRYEFAVAPSGVPLGYWRSVENSGNQFAISSFLDEASAAAGRDPVEFLLSVLGPPRQLSTGGEMGSEMIDIGRRRRVIETVAQRANWGKALPKGRGKGIATHFGYGSYVAQVAELSCDLTSGALRIHRVVCAIDCGTAINPLGVEAQMQSAINFGLAQTLKSEITVSRGRVNQSNFHDYEVLRMSDAPQTIDVHVIPSSDAPGGCGEPGVPPIAAAVGNAIFAATGKRIRRLPIRSGDLRSA